MDEERLTKKLESKIGGVFGLASDHIQALISLKKDQFEPNEDIVINFNIDNSKCGRDVKSFKAKLNREIVVFKEKGKKAPIFSKNEYLIEQKQPVDVKAKSKSEKNIIFKLPAEEKAEKTGPLDAMHPTL